MSQKCKRKITIDKNLIIHIVLQLCILKDFILALIVLNQGASFNIGSFRKNINIHKNILFAKSRLKTTVILMHKNISLFYL